MGDRDFRSIVENAINSIGKELEIKIDSANIQTIHLHEAVQCLRRSYYDRIDPQEVQRKGFNELLSGLLRKLQYGSDPKEFHHSTPIYISSIFNGRSVLSFAGTNCSRLSAFSGYSWYSFENISGRPPTY